MMLKIVMECLAEASYVQKVSTGLSLLLIMLHLSKSVCIGSPAQGSAPVSGVGTRCHNCKMGRLAEFLWIYAHVSGSSKCLSVRETVLSL
jgi:hypothetical protein